MGDKVAIYVRVSTDMQSTDMQKIDLLKYCDLHGFSYEIFEDVGSGKSADRPELKRLLEGIRRGEFSRLIIWKLDRLGRSVRDLTNIIFDLDKCGCQLISFKDSIDMSSPSGRLMLNLLASFAEFERALMIERTKGGLRAAKAKGVRLGAQEKPLDGDLFESLMRECGDVGVVAKRLGISKGHLYRKVRAKYGSIRMFRMRQAS